MSEELREIRKRLGVPQIALARAVGIERARLNMWERGFVDLKPEEIERITGFLAHELEQVKRLEVPRQVPA